VLEVLLLVICVLLALMMWRDGCLRALVYVLGSVLLWRWMLRSWMP